MVESRKIYADGTPELTQTTHYKPGSFEAIAQEQHTTGREGSEFFPVVIGPDGAPSAIYTSTGRRVWQADKQLWGRTDVRSSLRRQIMPGRAVNDESMIDCDLRFMGQWYDEESGLHYNLHRYYDPQTGQYLSTDPLGLAGGLNTHAYVHDPVNWCDPWGLQDCPTGLRWNDGKLNPSSKTNASGKNNVDWRGKGKTTNDALDEAFSRTGYDRSEFKITKWGYSKDGKSFPVEWEGPNSSQVSIDGPHYEVNRDGTWASGPDAPHVGWQYGSNNKQVGHILLDDVPYNR